MTPGGLEPTTLALKGLCPNLQTTGPESALLYFIRVIKADLLKWKLGSFSVVISTSGKVFISMDLAPRLCLASQLEGKSMLASNGTSQPLPNSNGGLRSHYPPHWRSLLVFYSLGSLSSLLLPPRRNGRFGICLIQLNLFKKLIGLSSTYLTELLLACIFILSSSFASAPTRCGFPVGLQTLYSSSLADSGITSPEQDLHL